MNLGRVLDASIFSGAWFPSQPVPASDSLIRPALGIELFAPTILRQEFANAAWKLERRGRITRDEVDIWIATLDEMGITFVEQIRYIPTALATARRFGQPRIFDAIYLACADDLGAELWTCDRRFVNSFGAERPSNLKLCPDDIG
ncbi:MAG: type II toxin-antitoxin system VapC family toxin [Dehalococcoidia bacterium]